MALARGAKARAVLARGGMLPKRVAPGSVILAPLCRGYPEWPTRVRQLERDQLGVLIAGGSRSRQTLLWARPARYGD